ELVARTDVARRLCCGQFGADLVTGLGLLAGMDLEEVVDAGGGGVLGSGMAGDEGGSEGEGGGVGSFHDHFPFGLYCFAAGPKSRSGVLFDDSIAAGVRRWDEL